MSVIEVVTTSSPGSRSSPARATCTAAVPEAQATTCSTPSMSATAASKRLVNSPLVAVSVPLSSTARRASSSSGPNERPLASWSEGSRMADTGSPLEGTGRGVTRLDGPIEEPVRRARRDRPAAATVLSRPPGGLRAVWPIPEPQVVPYVLVRDGLDRSVGDLKDQGTVTVGLGAKSIAFVLGTRPEMIKVAPLVKLFGEQARVVHTGQHYDEQLSGQFLAELGIGRPDLLLEIGGRSRGTQIGDATSRLEAAFAAEPPSVVVVHGDTNATIAGALAANATNIPLVHLEAGLRSFDRAMPEEHNRVVADHLADLCLAPTETNRANLPAEGIGGGHVGRDGQPR